MRIPVLTIRALLTALLFALATTAAWAQETMPGLPQPSELAAQSLRPYWHVFTAYAIVIVLVMGWVVSISKRLREVEERLGD